MTAYTDSAAWAVYAVQTAVPVILPDASRVVA